MSTLLYTNYSISNYIILLYSITLISLNISLNTNLLKNNFIFYSHFSINLYYELYFTTPNISLDITSSVTLMSYYPFTIIPLYYIILCIFSLLYFIYSLQYYYSIYLHSRGNSPNYYSNSIRYSSNFDEHILNVALISILFYLMSVTLPLDIHTPIYYYYYYLF